MTLYVGEVVVVRATAINPLNQQSIIDATGTIEFYAPGKAPATKPEDRTPEQGLTLIVTYDVEAGAYLAYVNTTSFAPGKWSYRVELTSSLFRTWEYGTFVLKA